jgi:hypothetical protein
VLALIETVRSSDQALDPARRTALRIARCEVSQIKEKIMAQGKDPQTADGLGGVHKVTQPRQGGVPVPRDAEPVRVAEGERAGVSDLVDDPDQIAKVVHPDVQVASDEPSVWTAAKTSTND